MKWQRCSGVWQTLRTHWRALPWMRTGLQRKPAVALALDRAWCTFFETRLPLTLQARDVWFQLQAEAASQADAPSAAPSFLQAGLAAEPMALDYTEVVDHQNGQVHYRVCAVPAPWLARLQAAVRAQGMQLMRVGVCDAQGRAWLQDAGGAQGDVPMPGEDAFWSDINLMPHRQMRMQRCRRAWAGGCMLALLCGAGLGRLAHAWWTDAQAAHHADAHTREQAQADLRHAQAQHDALRQAMQQHTQDIARTQAQQALHQHSLQWQAVLQANTTALWYSHLAQVDGAWRLSGQALGEADVQQVQTQLAALPIWQNPPVLKQWQALVPSAQTRWPVWQFELVAQLQGDATRQSDAKQQGEGKLQGEDKLRGAP